MLLRELTCCLALSLYPNAVHSRYPHDNRTCTAGTNGQPVSANENGTLQLLV